MPIKLQIISPEGTKWQSYCEHRLVALSLHREFLNSTRTPESRVRIVRQNYELPNRVRAMVISADICNIIRIEGGGIVGFIFHPRNSLFPGGFTPNGEAIATVYGYPLVDDDHGSRLITGDAGAWSYDANPPENYGNLDWIGMNGTVVSWRGPASRSFAMDPLHSYPGFTSLDYVSGFPEVEYYTPYRNLIYQSGDILFEFPTSSKVFGATDIYGVVGFNYAGQVNPAGGVGGYYTEIWHGTKARIGYMLGALPVPCFFNQTGNEAISGSLRMSINIDSGGQESVSFTALAGGSGTQTKVVSVGSPVPWKLNRSGSWPLHYGFKGNDLFPLTLTMVESQSTARAGVGESTFTDLPILFSGTAPTSITVDGPEWYTPGMYTATIEPEGASLCAGGLVWTFPTGCGMGVVTATLGPVSGSKSVRMPDGVWKLLSDTFASCSCDGCATTDPCAYKSIPPDDGCGYAWAGWAAAGYPPDNADLYEAGDTGEISGSARVVKVWRWGAAYGTSSNLGTLLRGFQKWVVVEEVVYEYWCTNLVKGW
jgi:hypothetical protein